jgi:hypothetical protein
LLHGLEKQDSDIETKALPCVKPVFRRSLLALQIEARTLLKLAEQAIMKK